MRRFGIALIVVGAILIIAGGFTWGLVRSELNDEKITVSADAEHFGGNRVDGPFDAYYEAEVIQKHALERTDNNTYAELDREDPRREVIMNASFLRASLFTSIVSFGVAALAAAIGAVFVAQGIGLILIDRKDESEQ